MVTPRLPIFYKSRALRVATLWAVLLAPSAVGLPAAEPRAATIRLVVDYGDGMETHFTAIVWREGLTVLDALGAAKSHRRGITFSHRGSGSSALITKIGDAENQGGGETSKNWMYQVNGKPAEVGAGVQKLKPGDVILWKFQV